MKILVFIPARSGSLGIKNKNLKKLGEKKLITYTFEISNKLSNSNFRAFLSTDSNIIKKIGKTFGFKDKYLRPKKLSGSKANIIDAVFDGINYLEKKNEKFTHVLLLQPTSPFRTLQDIKKILNIFKKKKLESICSISRSINNPIYYVEQKKANKWTYYFKKNKKIFNRQQASKNFFILDGSIYLSSIKFLKKYMKFVVINKTFLFKPNNRFNIDIDENIDLEIARKLIGK
tara:strand:+ start:533 stop:1225 length:693 start_codon:yes stop_codon:yes gene_type:complete